MYPFSSHGKWGIKPLLKCAAALKNRRKEKVEEGPKFRELILQWGPSQENSSGGHIVSIQDLSQLAVVILHSVAFIHYHVFPPNLQEREPVCVEYGKVQPFSPGQRLYYKGWGRGTWEPKKRNFVDNRM